MKYVIEFENTSPRLVGPFPSREHAMRAGERIAYRRGGMQAWNVSPLISESDANGLPETEVSEASDG